MIAHFSFSSEASQHGSALARRRKRATQCEEFATSRLPHTFSHDFLQGFHPECQPRVTGLTSQLSGYLSQRSSVDMSFTPPDGRSVGGTQNRARSLPDVDRLFRASCALLLEAFRIGCPLQSVPFGLVFTVGSTAIVQATVCCEGCRNSTLRHHSARRGFHCARLAASSHNSRFAGPQLPTAGWVEYAFVQFALHGKRSLFQGATITSLSMTFSRLPGFILRKNRPSQEVKGSIAFSSKELGVIKMRYAGLSNKMYIISW